jgi:two-component system sensor histidine kinase UhpB
VNIVPLRDDGGEVIGAINCFQDVTERKHAENALRDSGVKLQALSRRLVELQESERKELAGELHDRIGQSLTALNINLTILRTALSSQAHEVRARLADSGTLIESTIAAIRNLASELRPPMLDDHGLVLAIDWYARQFSARSGISVSVHSQGWGKRLAPQGEIALFRVAQEALNNVVKHARASRIEITLEQSGGECVMSVQDDGVGFDITEQHKARQPGLGMVTMRERAQAVGGHFEIQMLPGRGTRVVVRVPS